METPSGHIPDSTKTPSAVGPSGGAHVSGAILCVLAGHQNGTELVTANIAAQKVHFLPAADLVLGEAFRTDGTTNLLYENSSD